MSANYCEARHDATGDPETHCFHATGVMLRGCPLEGCCWCGEQTMGEKVPKHHGPLLDQLHRDAMARRSARSKRKAQAKR